MKRKDITYLIIAVAILLVAGYIVFTQLLPKKTASASKAGTQVEVVGSIASGLNQTSLTTLTTTSKSVDYDVQLNTVGGNTSVFGQ